MPDSGGESIELRVPHRHKLFIKHCTECVGVTSIIKSWHTGIEDALRAANDRKYMKGEMDEMRGLIQRMHGQLALQEVQLETAPKEDEVGTSPVCAHLSCVQPYRTSHIFTLSLYCGNI